MLLRDGGLLTFRLWSLVTPITLVNNVCCVMCISMQCAIDLINQNLIWF